MKSIKLNILASENLSKVEMNKAKGGVTCCICGCAYADQPGGSSTQDNGSANNTSGKASTKGNLTYVCQ